VNDFNEEKSDVAEHVLVRKNDISVGIGSGYVRILPMRMEMGL